jgi:conjugal transfer pilus assembly protein TraD
VRPEFGVLVHALKTLALGAGLAVGVGMLLWRLLRRSELKWTWAVLGLPAGWILLGNDDLLAVAVIGGSLWAALVGRSHHREALRVGVDLARRAENRVGPYTILQRAQHHWQIRRHGWLRDGQLVIGTDPRGLPVRIRAGGTSGSHTLVVGATGSGKTVTATWIAARLIDTAHAAVVIDPKGDQLLHDQLQAAADRAGVRFLEWSPEGPCAYNPYSHGGDTEIADKALAGETFTEPHYQRQAQRYLGHTVRTLHQAAIPITPATLVAHLDPRELEHTARNLKDEEEADRVLGYLDALTDRQLKDLAGVRDRLSILAESDTAPWLDSTRPDTPTIDLHEAIRTRAVVYFRLDADRRVLLSQMLAGAIISDLVTLIAGLQAHPVPAVVVIDEFAAVAAVQVARLFARARSAGVSLVLGAQELADLKEAGDGLREQVLGNVSSVIAHRQNVPDSAELLAAMGGTTPAWVITDQTTSTLFGPGLSGKGTQRRGYEFLLHPSEIKTLQTGQAAVITPGSRGPVIARIHHPDRAA